MSRRGGYSAGSARSGRVRPVGHTAGRTAPLLHALFRRMRARRPRRRARRRRVGRERVDASGRRVARARGEHDRLDLADAAEPRSARAFRFRRRLAHGYSRGAVSNVTPDVPSALSPLVRRVVANNPGLMTGPGTNTYLVGIEFRLEALHTPGHAPNHLCFLLDEDRALFTGDHVLNGTTTVVNPQRGGDMIEYMKSLERLRKIKRIARICPGHGDVIDEPYVVLDEYVAHRKMRERQILKLLKEQPRTVKRIVDTLYTDTPDGLIEMAQKQVYAHLLKLKTEGKVQGAGAKATWKLA